MGNNSLLFDPESHTYSLDGECLPSVTEVLSDVGIIDYSHIPEPTREMALERGRAVHLATQFEDEGDLSEGSITEDLRGYLEAWRRFRREARFVPELIEYRGFHPSHKYAGTLDRTGNLGGNVVNCLLDIKTNDAQEWVRYQLAAYAAFFDSPRKFRRMSVELHQDGSYRVREFPCRDWQADMNVFVSALNVYRAKRERIAS